MRPRFALVAVALTTLTRSAPAGEVHFGANDIPTLFFISKSEDRNRADYGMRLDGRCAPLGNEPVFPYWREFEPPPPVRTRPMSEFSKLGYGISTQQVVRRTETGGETAIKLKQVGRSISITTSRGSNGRCAALVRMTIGKVPQAELLSVFVKLSGPLKVAYLDIKGRDRATGKPIEERLKP